VTEEPTTVKMMRRFLLPAIAAGLAASFALAAPQPASANPAAAAINYDKPNAGVVDQVAKRYYKKRYRYGYRPYGYRYGYRPYYRPYGYYRPYYRPYGYYGGGYPYYRRPGVSLWFGF
jgi:hypothetical protein